MNARGTPLFEAVSGYAAKQAARFHVPGHKGVLPWLSGDCPARYDVTEADGCDSLYMPEGAIAATEERYAKLYQSAASLISAGGSTLCVQTMLALAVKPRQKLICGRGCHVSAINAMAVLDADPVWIFPEMECETGLALPISAGQVRGALDENPDAVAVYITSPDYYGRLSDIRAIGEICRARGVSLLIDNAHGAHLRFLEPPVHPIGLDADMCVDSLHKTLPVLTGGAMLHIKNERYIRDAKRYMSVFGSSSPSYLIMLSVDKALESLESGFCSELRRVVCETQRIEEIAKKAGFLVPNGNRDPVKLALGFSALGFTDAAFLQLARENGVEPELCAGGFAVLMASPQNKPEDFLRLERLIGIAAATPGQRPVPIVPRRPIRPVKAKTVREGVFAPSVEMPLEQALGRVSGAAVAPCPPGIPCAVPGELVDENLIEYLKSYGISRLNVLE